MQEQFHFERDRRVDLWFMRSALLAQFGSEPDRKRPSIDDQLCASILSARTHDDVWLKAFLRVKAHVGGHWHLLGEVALQDIRRLIPDVTFAERKAFSLKTLWRAHPEGFAHVAQMPVAQGLAELELNHGVGRKISAAALNFSTLRGRAFVADTHVLRVLQRFGFIGALARAKEAYDAVMPAAGGFEADDLFELHWHLKRLGQKVCTYGKANCGFCPLASSCMRRFDA